MAKLIYRPNDPNANENGMVEVSIDSTPNVFPSIIRDTMAPTRHMANNKVYDSKSEFRKATKAAGCIEVGNEPLRPRKPIVLDRGKRREDIRRTIYDLRNGIRHG